MPTRSIPLCFLCFAEFARLLWFPAHLAPPSFLTAFFLPPLASVLAGERMLVATMARLCEIAAFVFFIGLATPFHVPANPLPLGLWIFFDAMMHIPFFALNHHASQFLLFASLPGFFCAGVHDSFRGF